MQIIAVLNARSNMTGDDREARAAEVAEWWPSGVTAISFVITKPDAADERFVVHAIDAGEGRGMYTLDVSGDRLPALLGVLAKVIECGSLPVPDSPPPLPSVSVPVPPPPPPPIHPPPPTLSIKSIISITEFQQVATLERHHPAVALVTLQQESILRFEDIQNQPAFQ
jgi:hypothetical protein